MRHFKLNNRKGQAAVEMALVLPLLLLILLGILEFGRILSGWMVISNASREGARAAALGSTNTVIEQRIDDASATLNLEDIIVTVTPSGTRLRGTSVKVHVHYTIELITPFIGAIVGDPLQMDSETTMRVE